MMFRLNGNFKLAKTVQSAVAIVLGRRGNITWLHKHTKQLFCVSCCPPAVVLLPAWPSLIVCCELNI